MSLQAITLVGDGIENPGNARTMIHAAAMFESGCVFRDRCELSQAWSEVHGPGKPLPLISVDDLARDYSPIICLDNHDGAQSIYGFQPGRGPQPAVAVGNERNGLAKDVISMAHRGVQIPMISRKLNCLNVAAASAVALYYLSRGGGGKLQVRSQPNKRRPELLLLGAGDHVELGSSIRSAGAFGWSRLFVDDRQAVWFGCERSKITEGRAAARRARNPIHVIPTTSERRFAFSKACVVSHQAIGTPLQQADLAQGPQQLIIIPDDTTIDLNKEDWQRFAADVRFVRIPIPAREFVYHYRLLATIALAEAARQVGQKSRPSPGRPKRHEPFYDRSLKLFSKSQGETVFLEELGNY